MYRYKNLEGEYFCNKDFAKKNVSLPTTCALQWFPLAPSPPPSAYLQITDTLFVQDSKGPVKSCSGIHADCEDTAQQREVTIFLGYILK